MVSAETESMVMAELEVTMRTWPRGGSEGESTRKMEAETLREARWEREGGMRYVTSNERRT